MIGMREFVILSPEAESGTGYVLGYTGSED
jgi:hypothetical protein